MNTNDTNRSLTQPRLPAAVWALGFVSLLMDTSSELVHSLLPVFLVTAMGASAITVGLIEGVAESTALIVKVFSGVLSDYWQKRKGLAVIGYGLAAVTKPIFALAPNIGFIFGARFVDRIGKGIRGAPRDALIADVTPEKQRGAAFGLRQSLDTVGAFIGPLLAVGLMILWNDDFQTVFWFAVIPGALAVIVLIVGVKEPQTQHTSHRTNPIRRESLRQLTPSYWWLVGLGAVFSLARFSEAFLLLRAEQIGVATAWIPLILVTMNIVYALSAYPVGHLADRMSHLTLLTLGLLVLMIADLILAFAKHWAGVVIGVGFWGLHMGMTQGLFSAMVADRAPPGLRGTAFGTFNLVCGFTLLIASVLAGVLWDQFGPAATFSAGIVFCVIALGLILRVRR